MSQKDSEDSKEGEVEDFEFEQLEPFEFEPGQLYDEEGGLDALDSLGLEAERELERIEVVPDFEQILDSYQVCLWRGDSLEVLRSLPCDSVDALVTDPPSGIAFMGKAWDKDKGGYDAWVAWLQAIMEECLRVMKPGAHGFVWALPRTSHWTGRALELAGFEVRDVFTHIFGSGFPKNHDVSKAIDKIQGAQREVVGLKASSRTSPDSSSGAFDKFRLKFETKPATEEAKTWAGWGTAAKPAAEFYWLVRKPMAQSVASNVLEFGTGAVNIDGCRITHNEEIKTMAPQGEGSLHNPLLQQGGRHVETTELKPGGRWPSHLLLSHSAGCVRVGVKSVASPKGGSSGETALFSVDGGLEKLPINRYANQEGKEEIDDWECVDGCPVYEIGKQSGESISTGGQPDAISSMFFGSHSPKGKAHAGGVGDSGTAARYFQQFEHEPTGVDFIPFLYTAKPSTAEKNRGVESETTTVNDGRQTPIDNPYQRGETERKNTHPTVKPVSLMSYLIRFITPPGGIVLDPFTGSGTTGIGAMVEGMRFYGIELEDQSAQLAKGRIERALADKRGSGPIDSKYRTKKGFVKLAKRGKWDKNKTSRKAKGK